MKNIILILAMVIFIGCKKCEDCTTTITTTVQFKSYNGFNIGKPSITTTNSTDEICGSKDIKDAEGKISSTGKGPGVSNYAGSYSDVTVVEVTSCM